MYACMWWKYLEKPCGQLTRLNSNNKFQCSKQITELITISKTITAHQRLIQVLRLLRYPNNGIYANELNGGRRNIPDAFSDSLLLIIQ